MHTGLDDRRPGRAVALTIGTILLLLAGGLAVYGGTQGVDQHWIEQSLPDAGFPH